MSIFKVFIGCKCMFYRHCCTTPQNSVCRWLKSLSRWSILAIPAALSNTPSGLGGDDLPYSGTNQCMWLCVLPNMPSGMPFNQYFKHLSWFPWELNLIKSLFNLITCLKGDKANTELQMAGLKLAKFCNGMFPLSLRKCILYESSHTAFMHIYSEINACELNGALS